MVARLWLQSYLHIHEASGGYFSVDSSRSEKSLPRPSCPPILGGLDWPRLSVDRASRNGVVPGKGVALDLPEVQECLSRFLSILHFRGMNLHGPPTRHDG